MNIKTTLVLLVLVIVGGAWFLYRDFGAGRPADHRQSETLRIASEELQPDRLARIEIVREPERIRFIHGNGWSLEGNWPARTPEVQQVVDIVTGLASRFEPITEGDQLDFRAYGLAREQHPVQVVVTLRGGNKGTTRTLLFGESAADAGGNPFTKPTYLRLDSQAEIIRLAPGTKALLDRPRETYLKRQLFPDVERVQLDNPRPAFPGEPEPTNSAALLLDAQLLTLTGPDGAWTLKRIGSRSTAPRAGSATEMSAEKLARRWQLTAPVTDHVDPDKLRLVLAAVPELWVERFVNDPGPAKTGLDKPERTLAVEFDQRPPVKILIGAVSRVEERKITPPPANPLAPPPPPPPPIREEFRYAKLPENPQVFEIKTEKLGDLFQPTAGLRDAKLFRFKPTDVRRVEIVRGDEKTALVKEGDVWKLIEPSAADGDASRISELIDRLAELQASGPDIADNADLKALALEGQGGPHVTLSVAEKDKPDPETLTLRIGRRDPDKKKVAVQAVGISRINFISDDFLKLFDRPALAYRGKRLIDIPAAKVATVVVHRAGEQYTLAQKNGDWSLIAPLIAPADSGKAGQLARDLSRLDAVEFIAENVPPEELKKHGLDKPTASATLTFADGTPAKTLTLGAVREGKPEVYAKLADAPEVFTVRSAVRDEIDQSSLAMRPLQIWRLAPDAVASLDVSRADEAYRLVKSPAGWKLTGPFESNASAQTVQPLLSAVSNLRAERYETHKAADLGRYGLIKPAFQVTVNSPNGQSLLVGSPTAPNAKTRFAKLASSDPVFVVPESFVTAADRRAIDLLDRQLLSLNVNLISDVRGTGVDGDWALHHTDKGWLVQSLKTPTPADPAAVSAFLKIWANVEALRFVEIGPLVNFARYGLERPRTAATVTLPAPAGNGTESHTLSLGDKVRDRDAYFVRVDQSQGVAEIPASLAKQLIHEDLDFVHRDLLAVDPQHVAEIKRRGGEEIELRKGPEGWSLVKPAGIQVDQVGATDFAEQLARLRASKIATVDAKDPTRYGLDKPLVTISLVLRGPDGQTSEKAIEVGRTVAARYEEPIGSRYVRVAGSAIVGIVRPPLANRMIGEAFKFRDRLIARFAEADRAFLEAHGRRVAFAKSDGTWHITEPVAADAESADLDLLVNAVSQLRADELVAEHTPDLLKYGLNAPEFHWRFLNGDKDVLDILVGKDDGTGRRYAKLVTSDTVFLLDTALSRRIAAEYRKRSLWANLEASQIETLIYGAGDKTLVLQKVDGKWQVPGKPDQHVQSATADEVVSAFAALKAERYVADNNSDLARYGFQPPARTIVVRPRNGNPQTLYLGGFERGSKRVYARVYDPARSDVCVLSEADSAKLMRDLADFIEK